MSNHEACRQEIEKHRESVRAALERFAQILSIRGTFHDASKLEEPQFSIFASLPRDKSIRFGTPEYTQRLQQLAPALEHHYAVERHHPEHFAEGITGMNLLDLVEMFIDWQVTFAEHGSGTFCGMLAKNRERFGIDWQLFQILHNSAVDPCCNHQGINHQAEPAPASAT